MFSYLGGGTIK